VNFHKTYSYDTATADKLENRTVLPSFANPGLPLQLMDDQSSGVVGLLRQRLVKESGLSKCCIRGKSDYWMPQCEDLCK